jgi:hypothetical protein
MNVNICHDKQHQRHNDDQSYEKVFEGSEVLDGAVQPHAIGRLQRGQARRLDMVDEGALGQVDPTLLAVCRAFMKAVYTIRTLLHQH